MPYVKPEQLEKEADALLMGEPDSPDPAQPAPDPNPEPSAQPAEGESADGQPDPNAPEPKAQGDEAPPAKDPSSPPEEGKDDKDKKAEPGQDLSSLTPEQLIERLNNATSLADKRVKDFQAKMTRATQEAANLRRENGELVTRLQSLEAQVASIAKPGASKDGAAPVNQDSPSNSDLSQMREDYPSLGPLFDHVAQLRAVNERLQQKLNDVDGKITSTSRRIEEKDVQDAEERHYTAIRDAHADAFEIVESDDFQGWLERQPPMDQRAIRKDGTAFDVIAVIDRYKKAAGLPARVNLDPSDDPNPNPATPKNGQLPSGQGKLAKARAASTPNVRSNRPQQPQQKRQFTRAEIDAMPPAEFAKNEAAIDEAMARGEII